MRLKHLSATDPGGNALLDYEYEYDSSDNIVSKTTEYGTYTYGYDGASRLTSADNPTLDDESYSYDAAGNRTAASNATGNISHNANNELVVYGDVEYKYDANGNMTQKKLGNVAVNYIYNAENRLIRVEDELSGLVIAEYDYDPFGRRLWKKVAGVRTYFFYSDEGLMAEYGPGGTELRSYGYQPDSTWTTDPLFLRSGGQYFFYQNDHLGTPQKLTAVNGAIVWSAQYSAFGEVDIQAEAITNNLRFPGQYYDEETGLHYNCQRYYELETGRYLQGDPIEFEGGDVNLYGYVRNNPANGSDSMGLSGIGDFWRDSFHGRPEYLRKLPGIARNMGWSHLAELFERWFSNYAGTNYDLGRRNNTPDMTTVDLSWILSFDYAKQVYEKMIRDKIYQNTAALNRIRQEPQRVGITSFTSGTFGTPPPSPMSPWRMLRFHDDHELNTRSVVGNRYLPDELFAALARFNFYVIITKGDISVKNPTYQAACIRVTEIGMYVHDSFDFIGPQYLGIWSSWFNWATSYPVLPDIFVNTPAQVIGNGDFRRYQAATGRGGDFYIFSEIQRIPIKDPEWVALPLDPGVLPTSNPLPAPPLIIRFLPLKFS